VKRFVLLLLLVVGVACDEPGDQRSFSVGACEQFGVMEPVPVPSSCGIDIAGEGGTVRVFAVGAVIRYAEMEDYASFCTAWDEVVRTEVLPCLATDKPNLLVFPENATLAGAFIGSRGAIGRTETETLPAFASLFETYAEPLAYYRELYPDAAPIAQLVISLSDTLHRAFQTFPEMARQYGLYVAVSSDFAPARLSDDPADIVALADPDLEDVQSVYVATEGAAYNWGLYYGPDGEEIGRVAKSYLVPAEEELLSLTHGNLEQARPVAFPFARTGMVISKDAWMPGLLERLDALGANLMLQPEAFSGWAVEEFEGDWLPDIVRQSGWAHTQRHAGFRHTVTPCIKGNLVDLVFDCQSHVTNVTGLADVPEAFIGHDPYLGLSTVEPWAIEDPGPPASLEERRAILRDRGERMLPGSGDPLEDAYHAEVIAADLDLPTDGRFPESGDGPPGALGASEVVAEPTSPDNHQRFPALAVDDDNAIVAWMDGPPGQESVRAFVEASDGFAEVALRTNSNVVQRLPRAAVGAGRAAVVWEEEARDGSARIVGAVRIDDTWTIVDITDPAVGTAWAPDVAIDRASGRFVVTWLDLRIGGRAKPWLARSDDGQSWESTQVDPGNAIDDNPRGDAAFVRVKARDGEVFVAFSDFRAFSWDVYLSASQDGGAAFAPAIRVNPTAMNVTPVGGEAPVESERIHGDVALAIDLTGNPAVAWTERQDRRYESRVRLWRANVTSRVDDAPPLVDAWRPAIAVTPSAEILTVWQDLRGGTNRLRLAGATGPDLEVTESFGVDDTASGAHVYAPQIGVRGSTVWLVWEDPRSGYERVRLVRGAIGLNTNK
jgi:predicted amidohydrolase